MWKPTTPENDALLMYGSNNCVLKKSDIQVVVALLSDLTVGDDPLHGVVDRPTQK